MKTWRLFFKKSCNQSNNWGVLTSILADYIAPGRHLVGIFILNVDFSICKNLAQSLSNIGEVTVRILQFNSSDHLIERQVLIEVNRYPATAANQRMNNE